MHMLISDPGSTLPIASNNISSIKEHNLTTTVDELSLNIIPTAQTIEEKGEAAKHQHGGGS